MIFSKKAQKHFQDFLQMLSLRELGMSGNLLLGMSYFLKTHTETNLDKQEVVLVAQVYLHSSDSHQEVFSD